MKIKFKNLEMVIALHKRRVHLVGIGGYGMSAIACVLLDLGYQVSGSDIVENALIMKLIKRGARITIGHNKKNVEGAQTVVYSSSIAEDNEERIYAMEKGIEVLHRSQMLAQILNNKKGIAVAGAHGKTTTSSMIAQTLEMCGVDPTYIIGGEVIHLKGNAKAGKSDVVVAEADESDGSFLEYYPHVAVITNIEADHLENYQGDFEKLKDAYQTFLSQVSESGVAIVCWDDVFVREIAQASSNRYLSYGLDHDADFMATNIRENHNFITFSVKEKDVVHGEVTLQCPGRHNVANALAAIISCLYVGVPFEQIASALFQFKGTKRRFQIIGEKGNILVIDDYAHHPTEIKATLTAAKALGRRIVAIFQPQRYSRTHRLMDEFSRAFELADEVIIHTLYAPIGEEPIPGASAENLAALVKTNSNANTQFFASKEDIVTYLHSNSMSGDLVITMGAGDIWRVSYDLVSSLENKA